jgi:hypothetical protein
MGKASRRKKAKKQGFQNPKTFIISESTLKEVVEALEQNADFQEVLPENKTDFSPCPDCWTTEAYAAPSQTVHWAEWKCLMCDRHRGWIQNPANTLKWENENQLIDRLLQTGQLNVWERMFCQSVKQTRKRSPRQIEKLSQIASRLGISAACEGVEA